MGLSSFFNPDILIGMGRARDAERQNLLTAETERRNKATSLLTKIFDSEDSLPETREEALR